MDDNFDVNVNVDVTAVMSGKTREQKTCKTDLNRKMLERPKALRVVQPMSQSEQRKKERLYF